MSPRSGAVRGPLIWTCLHEIERARLQTEALKTAPKPTHLVRRRFGRV
jgi:hypothetical protein